MKSILLALALFLTVGSVANADDIFDYLDRAQQQTATVEKHPKADEPVDIRTVYEILDGEPLAPYIAQQVLRGDAYKYWARKWNAYQDEVARRSQRTHILYGTTTTRTQTTNGTVTRVNPRFWIRREGSPGEIRYNPFVQPRTQHDPGK